MLPRCLSRIETRKEYHTGEVVLCVENISFNALDTIFAGFRQHDELTGTPTGSVADHWIRTRQKKYQSHESKV